jgi:hypothetical protein
MVLLKINYFNEYINNFYFFNKEKKKKKNILIFPQKKDN